MATKLSRPQDFNAELTAERLRVIGEIILNAHNSAVDEEDPDQGDGNWSTGCRSYQRVRGQLERLAENEEWLGFRSEGSLAFYILVGSCPIRIRKDDQHRSATQSEITAVAQTTMFGVRDSAVLRAEKVVDPATRMCTSVNLLVVSTDDSVVYEGWEIYKRPERPEGVVVEQGPEPEPPYDPGTPPITPKGTGTKTTTNDAIGTSE